MESKRRLARVLKNQRPTVFIEKLTDINKVKNRYISQLHCRVNLVQLAHTRLVYNFRKSLITTTTMSDISIDRITPGDGKTFPKTGDLVTMHYDGTLENGKKFDSSRDRGKPFQTYIGVGQVIQGWDKGIPQLSLGEKARITIPGSLAYGPRGFPGLIPPNATLIFEVELLGIN